ncbi:NAD(P)-binding protein [Auricularia subglabra TFB-10046 SS5]|nr:NAD(P)-binding protein [Auricularia subglabra TFB-10046 SS5]
MPHPTVEADIKALLASGTLCNVPNAQLVANAANLKGKVVVITGAGSGFGRAFALKAASYGAHVVLGDLVQVALDETLRQIANAGGTARGRNCDVTSWEEQVALFALAQSSFGRVDVVVANAGIGESGPEQFHDTDELRKPDLKTIDVNVVGLLYTVHIGLHHLRKNPSKEGKKIILLGSYSSFYGSPLSPGYTMSKHGVLGFARSLLYIAGRDGIGCSVIAPYFVDTAIMAAVKNMLENDRLSKIEDVVDALVFASSAPKPGLILLVDPDGVLAEKKRISPFALPRL